MNELLEPKFMIEKLKEDLFLKHQVNEDFDYDPYNNIDGRVAKQAEDGKYYIDGIEIKIEWCKTD
ncbi:MAG: hypothetical protein FWE36_01410 [Erysipelotrichales bacterium]|nr:hypothetical protein [Erysipelotrichales bacterium]